jgi:predicted acylesterase/phospholipase RssA
VGGSAIKGAAQALLELSDHKLGLTRGEIVVKVLGSLATTFHLPSGLADNAPIKGIVEGVFTKLNEPRPLTVGDFDAQPRARLFVGATDIKAGERKWFPPTVAVADCLVASSAIPGVFPPHPITIDGTEMLFVDGAVAQNQPLSTLVADASCGTIFACAVGYDGQPQDAPADALDNVMKSISILSHEFSEMEQDYVEAVFKLAGVPGAVHHIHPWGKGNGFPINGFDFTADMIQTVMGEACDETKAYIQENGLMPAPAAAPPAAPVPVGASSGAGPNGGNRN